MIYTSPLGRGRSIRGAGMARLLTREPDHERNVFADRCDCGHLVIAHGSKGCLVTVRGPGDTSTGHGSRCSCKKPDTLTAW
jgi:hypothetical protein